MSQLHSKQGIFVITKDFFEDSQIEALHVVMDKVIVLHAQSNFGENITTYWFYHPDLEEVPLGCRVPQYKAQMTKTINEDETITLTRTWEKAKPNEQYPLHLSW